MRIIPSASHRILDFVTVVAFAGAPSILGLTGFAAGLSYLLAVVHLAMTLLTRFSSGERRPLSLRLHGAVELVVGATLLALPWLADWHGSSRLLYLTAGAAVLLAWTLTRYQVETQGAPA